MPNKELMRMQELAGIIREVEIVHNDYIASHGKQARGDGNWAFGKRRGVDVGKDKEGIDYVFIGGKFSRAAKEAAKKLNVKTVWVMP